MWSSYQGSSNGRVVHMNKLVITVKFNKCGYGFDLSVCTGENVCWVVSRDIFPSYCFYPFLRHLFLCIRGSIKDLLSSLSLCTQEKKSQRWFGGAITRVSYKHLGGFRYRLYEGRWIPSLRLIYLLTPSLSLTFFFHPEIGYVTSSSLLATGSYPSPSITSGKHSCYLHGFMAYRLYMYSTSFCTLPVSGYPPRWHFNLTSRLTSSMWKVIKREEGEKSPVHPGCDAVLAWDDLRRCTIWVYYCSVCVCWLQWKSSPHPHPTPHAHLCIYQHTARVAALPVIALVDY